MTPREAGLRYGFNVAGIFDHYKDLGRDERIAATLTAVRDAGILLQIEIAGLAVDLAIMAADTPSTSPHLACDSQTSP